jgi:hypothetical protein
MTQHNNIKMRYSARRHLMPNLSVVIFSVVIMSLVILSVVILSVFGSFQRRLEGQIEY